MSAMPTSILYGPGCCGDEQDDPVNDERDEQDIDDIQQSH